MVMPGITVNPMIFSRPLVSPLTLIVCAPPGNDGTVTLNEATPYAFAFPLLDEVARSSQKICTRSFAVYPEALIVIFLPGSIDSGETVAVVHVTPLVTSTVRNACRPDVSPVATMSCSPWQTPAGMANVPVPVPTVSVGTVRSSLPVGVAQRTSTD